MRRARAEAEAERARRQQIQADLVASYIPSTLPSDEAEGEVLMEIGISSSEWACHSQKHPRLSQLWHAIQILAQGPATFFQEPNQRYFSTAFMDQLLCVL